nr:hypothetical protein [Tanacetum cinerariifolium]
MLHQAFRFSKKLEQSLLLGGREGVPDYYELAYECSKRWDVGREYVFLRGCDNIEHTPYPNPETTRGTTLLSRVEPQILPGRRDMDLFNLIRAPNPTKSTGPEDQEAAAPEVSHPKNVTTMGIALEAGPVERGATTDPPAVKERRKRGHDGVNTNAPPKNLKYPLVDQLESLKDAPMDVIMASLHLKSDTRDDAPQWVCELRPISSQLTIPVYPVNLETLLEAETDMKKAAENKSVKLRKELENMRALFSDLQVSNNRLSQQVSTLQEQVSEEEKLKAAFEESSSMRITGWSSAVRRWMRTGMR